MKSKQLVNDALSAWRNVENAPDLAHDLFASLDDDERERLALRAFTDEIRTALRRKDTNGVPTYTSILVVNGEGEKKRTYKQTQLFTEDDYTVAVRFYTQEARANLRVARALIEDCSRRLGIQLSIEGAA